MKKKILLCTTALSVALVVHCQGGQDNTENIQKQEIIIEKEIKQENKDNKVKTNKTDKTPTVGGSAITTKKNDKEENSSAKKIECETDRYTNTYVNMRKGNSTDTEIIITLNPNVMVRQYYIENGWSYVCLDEETFGYIKSEYLSDTKIPISELNRWNIELTEEEIELLAKILYLEANIEPYEGQVAVVETVFNRMSNGRWENSLYEVLSASGQFVTWKNRNIAKPTSLNYKVIDDVLNGKTNVLPMNYLYFSQGGHKSHKNMIQIGIHQFCTEG